MNLKKILSGVVACSALVFLVGCQQDISVNQKNVPQEQQQQNSATSTPSTTLQLSGSQQLVLPSLMSSADQAAYQDAVTKNDAKNCDQIKDAKSKQQCQTAVADSIVLNAALNKSDPSLCQKLSTKDRQDACKSQVDAKIKSVTDAKQYEQELQSEQKLGINIIASGDYTRCKELKIEGVFKNCELDILKKKAIDTKDLSWCEKAISPDIQQNCKNIVNKVLQQ